MDEVKAGETVESKEILEKAPEKMTAEEFARLTTESGKEELEAISTGESQFSQALLGKQEAMLEQDLAKTQNDYQQKEGERDACVAKWGFAAASAQCEGEFTAVSNAQKELDEKQRKLMEMQQYAQSLKNKSVQLDPKPPNTTVPELPNRLGFCDEQCQQALANKKDTFNKPDPQDDPPCQGVMCELRKYLGPDTSSDTYKCQRLNDYAACMRVGGGGGGAGAYGGYGGASASGSCGSQQQQQRGGGGLFGVVMSLFTKSKSSGSQNCQNGVPVPSCTITASPTNVAAGQPVTLTWQSQQAFSANLSTSGSVAPQGSMTVNPQTTTSYVLQLSGYVDNRSGQQLRGQCAVQVTVGGQGGGDGAPKAEISCRPEVADVGMSVALSFGCRNSATSGGTGFDTNNQLSGSATPVIEQPTIGTSVAKYGLTCSKEGKTDTAECTVKINKPTIVLIANPKEVIAGGEANIGWVTGGMEECTISSPTLSGFTAENAGNNSTSGVAKTPPLTEDTKFVLSCTTKAGATKTAETTVTIR
jgi:hypothetical protein